MPDPTSEKTPETTTEYRVYDSDGDEWYAGMFLEDAIEQRDRHNADLGEGHRIARVEVKFMEWVDA